MKRYLIAATVGVFIVVGMFLLDLRMRSLASEWLQSGIEIPLHNRILLGVSAFWERFGLLLSPVIIAGCLAVAVVADLLKPAPR